MMGCQKEIAKKIVAKEADYMLALKGNQGTLNDDVELFLTEQKACKFKDTVVSRHQTLEKSHGRIAAKRASGTTRHGRTPPSTLLIGSKSVTTGRV